MTTVWMLGELAGEDEPDAGVVAAARSLLGRLDPSRWVMPQQGVEAVVLAAAVVAADPLWSPGPLTTAGSPWEPVLQLVIAALRDERDPARGEGTSVAWAAVEADKAGTAELIARLSPSWSHAFNARLDVEAVLASRHGERLAALLEWALEHADELSRPEAVLWDGRRAVIAALGRVGGPGSARLLREHLEDPASGPAAAEALRELDRRQWSKQ